MVATAFVRARIDEILKEKALPFEMRIPNKLTVKTLLKSDNGKDVHKAKDKSNLFKQLGV